MTCTVMYQNDLADRLLNSDIHPEWNGIRKRMIEQMPERMDMWDTYETLYRDDSPRAAQQYYRENQTEMSRGAVVSWPERYNEQRDTDALEAAFKLRVKSIEAFHNEAQNEPDLGNVNDAVLLAASEIAVQQHEHERFIVPDWTQHLIVAADVQDQLIYYVAVAVGSDFRIAVIEYATLPRVGKNHFKLSEIKVGMQQEYAGSRKPQDAIAGGVAAFCKMIKHATLHKQNGDDIGFSKIFIDSGYQPKAIAEGIKQAQCNDAILTKGFAKTATQKPFSEFKIDLDKGERRGHEWVYRRTKESRRMQLQYDSNIWENPSTRIVCHPTW